MGIHGAHMKGTWGFFWRHEGYVGYGGMCMGSRKSVVGDRSVIRAEKKGSI